MVTISNTSRGRAIDAPHVGLRKIVVVVPAHNERDRLPACLSSIAAAALEVAVPVTVVVVLDGCTDGTEDVIPSGVRSISISARNVGEARATGFRVAAPTADSGTWLATTDADTVVPLTWFAKQINHHAALAEGMVGTVAVDWREYSTSTQRRYDWLYRLRAKTHGHVHGANLGVRADAYWRVGGFQPLQVGEDVDLVERLISSLVPLVCDTRNAVLTSDRSDCRAQGGFGDYVRSIADSAVDATSRRSA